MSLRTDFFRSTCPLASSLSLYLRCLVVVAVLVWFCLGVARRARRGPGAVRDEEGTREARRADSGRGLQPVVSCKVCVVGLNKAIARRKTHTYTCGVCKLCVMRL